MRWSTHAGLAGALLAWLSPEAASAAEPHSMWLSEPTRAEWQAAWPEPAKSKEIPGRAVARCAVDIRGVLSNCRVQVETPRGMGFGEALLSLAPKWRLNPAEITSRAPTGEVSIVDVWAKADNAEKINWERRPSSQELGDATPPLAQRTSGRAEMNCAFGAEGKLFDCVVVYESPPGAHLGEAAISLAPRFRITPPMYRGRPTLGVITVPIVFISTMPIEEPFRRTFSAANLTWSQAPTAADVAAAYPSAARATRVAGKVTLTCRFTGKGELRKCAVQEEEPKGLGFGSAALSLTEKFRLDPADVPNVALGSTSVMAPITFAPKLLDIPASVMGRPILAQLPDLPAVSAALARTKPAVMTGTANIKCTVAQGGRLSACAVVAETPAGSGLGGTALALQNRYRFTTWSVDGLPIAGGAVTIPLRFDIPAPPAAK